MNKEYYRKYREQNREKIRNYHTKWSQKWRKDNRVLFRKIHREFYQKLRLEVINHYGAKCKCCGEENIIFLVIDHVNGGGNKHRKTIGSRAITTWIKKNNYPKEFQILCYNCNMAKSILGQCIHCG